MISTIHLCQHLSALLHIQIRIFEADGSPVDIGHSETNQGDPLVSDPAFLESLLETRTDDMPQIIYEAESVAYAVIPANGERTVVMGPACYDTDTREKSMAVALLHSVGNPDQFRLEYVPLFQFAESVLLIFHSHSDRDLSREELLLGSRPREYSSEVRAEAYSLIYDNRENAKSHNSYAQEQREQKAVREGNVQALKKSWSEVQTGNVGRLAPDELTHFRYLTIVILTLASRSAIEGGVLPEVAYSLADSYSMKLAELSDPAEINNMARSAELHFTELVAQANRKSDENIYIRRCKELIHDRLHERVYEDELADALGISRSYLSQLFIKEEGIHLSEYILRQKVRSSEYLLIYPDIPLGSIAATFGFSSQSHYGQAFKRFKGITPGKYREQYLKNNKKN